MNTQENIPKINFNLTEFIQELRAAEPEKKLSMLRFLSDADHRLVLKNLTGQEYAELLTMEMAHSLNQNVMRDHPQK